MNKNFIVPKRIQLELSFGCNADCIMCPVNIPTSRTKGIMSFDLFMYIVDELSHYANKIEKFDLWGLGEPLLDKTLCEKIKYAKSGGFHNLAIATNADLLNEEKQDLILESNLDTIIFSIDGIKKETHEEIRKGVKFERIIDNVLNIIAKRNNGGFNTRFVLRFIRQERNKGEWEKFKEFWNYRVSKERGDIIIGYDMHSWGGELPFIEKHNNKRDIEIDKKPCHHVFDRLIILWDGTVPLCCSDMHHGEYFYGNVNDFSPIEIFNNQKIKRIREINLAGEKNSMKICAACTILESEKKEERN